MVKIIKGNLRIYCLKLLSDIDDFSDWELCELVESYKHILFCVRKQESPKNIISERF